MCNLQIDEAYCTLPLQIMYTHVTAFAWWLHKCRTREPKQGHFRNLHFQSFWVYSSSFFSVSFVCLQYHCSCFDVVIQIIHLNCTCHYNYYNYKHKPSYRDIRVSKTIHYSSSVSLYSIVVSTDNTQQCIEGNVAERQK